MNLLRKYYDKESNGGGIPDEVRVEKAYQLLKKRAKESYLSHGSFSASPFGLDGIPYVKYDAISKLMVEFSDSELSLASEEQQKTIDMMNKMINKQVEIVKEKNEEIFRLKAENERLRGEVDVWHNYSTDKPPVGIEVIGQSDEWINEDYNPNGVRIGFQNIDEENGPFITAKWNDYQDFYDTIEDSKPTKWKYI